jgi:MFS family permease
MAAQTEISNAVGAPVLATDGPINSGTIPNLKVAAVAWFVASTYFFFQYVLRSAPSVMMPQLARAFGVNVAGAASLVGVFYYGYTPFCLIAGAGMDRFGPRKVIPIGAAVAGFGALLFASGGSTAGSIGRLLQGAGGAFAPIGALYIASKYFPPSQAATLIGATQMFGMSGGAAGQFFVARLIARGLSWDTFWVGIGISCFVISVVMHILLPKNNAPAKPDEGNSLFHGLYVVFKNPQSILCGLIAGLLFVPTTIFDMVWGVRYLQEAHGFDYASAVLRTSMVPLGWIIGCPLLGFISDKLGRRKPVIIGAATALLILLAWILFGPKDALPPYVLGLLTGIASGGAMLPYTVIKEANSPHFGGIATGVVSFLNFTFSALLGPVFAWLLQRLSREAGAMRLEHYQMAFAPLLLGVAIAIALTFLLKETGSRPSVLSRE